MIVVIERSLFDSLIPGYRVGITFYAEIILIVDETEFQIYKHPSGDEKGRQLPISQLGAYVQSHNWRPS